MADFAKSVKQASDFEIPAIIFTRLSHERGLRSDSRVPKTELDGFDLTKEIRVFNRIWRVAQDVDIAKSSQSTVHVNCQGSMLQLTRKQSNQVSLEYENMALTNNGDNTFIAAAGDMGATFELFCFDAKEVCFDHRRFGLIRHKIN